MRKIIFFGIGIVLLSLAALGVHRLLRQHTNVESEPAAALFSAPELYHMFFSHEAEATRKWVGKVIEITGTVASLNETGNFLSIGLRATPDGGINCNVLKKDLPEGEPVHTGDSLRVKGRCSGFLIDVNMVDCVIKK